MIKNRFSFVAIAIGVLIFPLITTAANAVPTGELKVIIDTPANAPATISLNDSFFIAKSATKKNFNEIVLLEPGKLSVSAPSFVFQGQLFTAPDAPKKVKVVDGELSKLTIKYVAVGVAGSLSATKVTASEISLSWSNPDDVTFEIRRTKGKKVAANVNAGVLIAKKGVTNTDDGVNAGTTYTYALFSKVDGEWQDPISIRVSSANADTQTAAYASNPGTVFVTNALEYSISWSDNQMVMQIPSDSPLKLPVIGTSFAFGQSDWLPDGYLGKVSQIGQDGTEIWFKPAGFGDAFNFYKLSAESDGSGTLGTSLTCTSDTQVDSVVSVDATAYFNGSVNLSSKGKMVWPNDQRQGNGQITVDGDLVFESSTDVHTVESVNCDTQDFTFTQNLALLPVPFNFNFTGKVNVVAESAVEISDIASSSTTQLSFDSSVTKGEAPTNEGSSTTELTMPNDPVLVDNGDISIVASGTFGFGAANAMYGEAYSPIIGGDVVPFSGTNSPVYAVLDSRFNLCQQIEGSSIMNIEANQIALVGKLTKHGNELVDDYSSTDLFTDLYVPGDCESLDLPPGEQTIYGNGINKYDDNISDNPDQWNHFQLFNNGLSGWVLSTGDISQVAQTPGNQASTPLTKPGDPLLDLLSGQITHDAVRYTINITPTGNYLHIMYAFASEEYPEYVDQEYNDVMAILVNGVNCAFVPGTETPVAINTINDHTNSEYYVNNWSQNSDTLNVFDGMTVPLTCNAQVTPNQPVTVQIIVADAYDEFYDSAVALFDNGIWSDNSAN